MFFYYVLKINMNYCDAFACDEEDTSQPWFCRSATVTGTLANNDLILGELFERAAPPLSGCDDEWCTSRRRHRMRRFERMIKVRGVPFVLKDANGDVATFPAGVSRGSDTG